MFLVQRRQEHLTIAFQVSETLLRCENLLHFLNYCSLKMKKILIQNIWPVKIYIRKHAISWVRFPISVFSCQVAVKKWWLPVLG